MLRAGTSDQVARRALEDLCHSYWYPLYVFLRRGGKSMEDAEDLVQAFFLRLVEINVIGYADPNRGRFRSFLITSMKQFLAKERIHRLAMKRHPGGLISIDAASADERYRLEPVDSETPERLYERSWALTVLEQVMERLRREFVANDNEPRFLVLKEGLTGRGDVRGRELAERLGLTEGAARIALHRVKRRYGELLREELAQTLETPAEVDDELRYLMTVLRG